VPPLLLLYQLALREQLLALQRDRTGRLVIERRWRDLPAWCKRN